VPTLRPGHGGKKKTGGSHLKKFFRFKISQISVLAPNKIAIEFLKIWENIGGRIEDLGQLSLLQLISTLNGF
jgi:hypothetical protein